MVRILLTGLAAAVAMFVWQGLAHEALPLGEMGITPLPGQPASVDTIHSTVGDKPGLYAFPWVPNSTEMKVEGPSGFIVYRTVGWGAMTPLTTLVPEFVLELIECLILVGLLAQIAGGFVTRLGWGIAAGVMVGITTNGSYHFFYGFPLDYTLAQIVMIVVGFAIAGAVAGLLLPRRA